MEQQLQLEEAEKFLSWRENGYGRPISVITLVSKEGVKMYYAPASLYWNLKNRLSETNFIKYEETQTSERGYEDPVFKFAK